MDKKNLDRTKSTIQKNQWKRLLLAVSGGVDSICLANYFIESKEFLGLQWIGIAHIHHGLREGAADLDAKLVEEFAKKNNVDFFLRKLDGEALKNADRSIEEAARDARYEALLQFAMETQADAVVTAHHAGDQAETLYLRLARGTTLAGIHGIQEVRPFADISLYRPFLHLARKDLVQYAREQHLEWREDESNSDVKFARNKIRNELLPAMECSNAGIAEQLIRIGALGGKIYVKILQKAETLFGQARVKPDDWPVEKASLPYANVIALKAEFLSEALNGLSPEKASGFGEMFRLWLDHQGFRFPIETFGNKSNKELIPSTYSYRNRHLEKCRNILWIYKSIFQEKCENLYFLEDKQRFSHVDGVWRKPEEGDILAPLDMKIKSRPLKQWLQEKGVPHWIRPHLNVFAKGNQVYFVSGIRIKKNR